MDHDPKLVLLTCLFLAAKVENSYIPLVDFLNKVNEGWLLLLFFFISSCILPHPSLTPQSLNLLPRNNNKTTTTTHAYTTQTKKKPTKNQINI